MGPQGFSLRAAHRVHAAEVSSRAAGCGACWPCLVRPWDAPALATGRPHR